MSLRKPARALRKRMRNHGSDEPLAVGEKKIVWIYKNPKESLQEVLSDTVRWRGNNPTDNLKQAVSYPEDPSLMQIQRKQKKERKKLSDRIKNPTDNLRPVVSHPEDSSSTHVWKNKEDVSKLWDKTKMPTDPFNETVSHHEDPSRTYFRKKHKYINTYLYDRTKKLLEITTDSVAHKISRNKSETEIKGKHMFAHTSRNNSDTGIEGKRRGTESAMWGTGGENNGVPNKSTFGSACGDNEIISDKNSKTEYDIYNYGLYAEIGQQLPDEFGDIVSTKLNLTKRKNKRSKRSPTIRKAHSSDIEVFGSDTVRSVLTEHQNARDNDTAPIVIEIDPDSNPKPYFMAEDVLGQSCDSSSGENTEFLLGHSDVVSLLKSSTETYQSNIIGNSSKSVAVDYVAGIKNNLVVQERVLPYKVYIVPNNKVLLVMSHPSTLYFRGIMNVSVLIGSIEVLGYRMLVEDNPRRYTVYCPRGSSLLGIQTCSEKQNANDRIKTINTLVTLGMDSSLVQDIMTELCSMDCVVLLERTTCVLVEFVSKHFSPKVFPIVGSHTKKNWQFNSAEKKLLCDFVLPDTKENVKLYAKRLEWENIMESVIGANPNKGTIRTVLCGGKSVGKSTLLRYLVNRSLPEFKQVLCLDFDPGQAEFTMPGCVSVVVVREPLLGPNFTHLLTPLRSIYIGDINMAQCPHRYLECANDIIKYCQSRPELLKMPWFINTMGFNKGLGELLMISLIRMLDPRDVIQIESSNKKRNYPSHLNAVFVNKYRNSWRGIPEAAASVSNYNLHVVPSAAEFQSSSDHSEWGLQPSKMRELCILSYFSQMVTPPGYSLTDILPYTTQLSKIKLCVSHEVVPNSQILAAMNGNLVALCIVSDDDAAMIPSDPQYPEILAASPVCPCLGFGIIRGIDMEEKQLFLITSVPKHELAQVNCLVMGVVNMPDCIRLYAYGLVGHIPYTAGGQRGPPTGRSLRSSRSAKQLQRN